MKRTRTERTLDGVLNDIQAGQGFLEETRRQLHAARRGHLPVRPELSKATTAELQAWDERAELIAHLEGEERRLVENLALAWDVAAGLSEPPGRLPGSDEEVAAQVRALEARRSALARKAGTFAEDRHDAVEALLAFHAERLDALLAVSPVGAGEVEEIVRLWSVRDPALAEALHAAVDAEEGLAENRAGWQAELDLLARQAERRRRELELRAQERAAVAAERERREAEVRLAAVGAGEEVGS